MKPHLQNKKQIKSYLIKMLLVCLGIAGSMGIWALLIGGFGAVQGNVLMSTVMAGVFSVLLLVFLAISDKPYGWLGIPGVVASTALLLLSLFIIWSDFSSSQNWEVYVELLKLFVISGIIAASCAHAGLLLLLSQSNALNIRICRTITLGTIGLIAFILIAIILNAFEDTPEVVVRLLGVLAIIDAIGTVAIPVLTRLNVQPKA